MKMKILMMTLEDMECMMEGCLGVMKMVDKI